MDLKELNNLVTAIIAIAEQASEAILKVYNDEFDVETKQDKSPVTEADRAANEIIVTALSDLTPRLPILSEESNVVAFEERKDWQQYWLLDPLDGTREFIKKNDEFAICLALMEDNKPVFGFIYAPVTKEAYCAYDGVGAFKIIDRELHPIHAKPWQKDRTNLLMSRSHANRLPENIAAALGEISMDHIGSALKFGRVAAGEADLYVRTGPTSEWDTAAGQCILQAMGGSVVDFNGQPLCYNAKPDLLNPFFFAVADPTLLAVVTTILRSQK